MADRILVLAEHEGGALRERTWELLGLAHRLGGEAGKEVGAVLLGSGVQGLAEQLAARGGCEVLHVDDPALAEYTQQGYGRMLEQVVQEESPWMVLASHGPTGWEVMPGLAAALGAAMATEIMTVTLQAGTPLFTARAFNGKFEVQWTLGEQPPFLATVQRGAHEPVQSAAAGSVRAVSCSLGVLPLRTRYVETRTGESGAVDLTQATVIVSGGRSLGGPEKFDIIRELAETLGGQVGASRPVTDAGWLPAEHQVGSSGVTVTPKLYIAAGISGAIQHIAGMKGAGYIVAINKDAEAPIFQVADVGIVGDLFEVVPALTKAVQQAKG
jgi:electron transfer flavoprotein alpha subunit